MNHLFDQQINNNLLNIYYIGGSPCSGKSTIAKMAAEKYGFLYFEVDEQLGDYLKRGAKENKPFCSQSTILSFEEQWMRDPAVQSAEELAIYREIFEYAVSDLAKLESSAGIITEGAAYLPELIHQLGIDKSHYINLTPTRDFQYTYYSQRTWVPLFLEGCKDKKQAFTNWMERDVLFAQTVRQEAKRLGYHTLITDGSQSIETVFQKVSSIMKWGLHHE